MYEFIGWTQQQMKQTHTRKSWLAGWRNLAGRCVPFPSGTESTIDGNPSCRRFYTRAATRYIQLSMHGLFSGGGPDIKHHTRTHTLSVSHSLSRLRVIPTQRQIFGGWQKRARDGEIEWEFSIQYTVYFARLQWHREEEKCRASVYVWACIFNVPVLVCWR